MESKMTAIQELKFWVDVIEKAAIPANGERLTRDEQAALSQTYRGLAQTALYAADKMESSAIQGKKPSTEQSPHAPLFHSLAFGCNNEAKPLVETKEVPRQRIG